MSACRPTAPKPLLRFEPAIVLRPLLGLSVLLALGCSSPDPTPTESEVEPPPSATTPSSAPPVTPVRSAEGGTGEETLVIFLGDSLTAGYGLDEEQSFPALLAAGFEAEGRGVRVVNAGISGDTTAGGLNRLDWLLGQEPDILVVGLGGNDGLRGVDLSDSEENLRQIVTRGIEAGAEILLAGMLIPPNYGPDYTQQFAEIYPKLAEQLGVDLIPFLLEGVAADPALNLADGIHPNAEGQKIVAQTVLRHLEPLLEKTASPGGENTP